MTNAYKRFLTLQRRVMQAIRRELEADCHCKGYEGTFELIVGYPSYFDCTFDDAPVNEPNFYMIKLHCYVLGPGRHYEWRGSTFESALNKCEADINSWIKR